jgi:hypothetical protein
LIEPLTDAVSMATRELAAMAAARSAKLPGTIVAGAVPVPVAGVALVEVVVPVLVARPGLAAAACSAAICAWRCARSSCGPATKNCQPKITTTLSTMAMIMLRLVSVIYSGPRRDALGVHFGYGGRKVGNDPGKRQTQGLAAAHEHIIMLGLELIAASLEGCAQTPLDAVALRRVAGLLGYGEPDPGLTGRVDRNRLQRKGGASGSDAARSIEELAPLGEPPQTCLGRRGRGHGSA